MEAWGPSQPLPSLVTRVWPHLPQWPVPLWQAALRRPLVPGISCRNPLLSKGTLSWCFYSLFIRQERFSGSGAVPKRLVAEAGHSLPGHQLRVKGQNCLAWPSKLTQL